MIAVADGEKDITQQRVMGIAYLILSIRRCAGKRVRCLMFWWCNGGAMENLVLAMIAGRRCVLFAGAKYGDPDLCGSGGEQVMARIG